MKMKQLRFIRNILLSLLLLLTTLDIAPVLAVANIVDINEAQYEFEEELVELELELPLVTVEDELDENASLTYSILTETLADPIGMQGFHGEYAIGDPNEMIEIIVEFVTPPAVALRLMQEEGIPLALSRTLPRASFEEQALTAHDIFNQQLNRIPTPFSTAQPEILSKHYSLLNGVFMRVPGRMVSAIADLPEVYGVFPNVANTLLKQESMGAEGLSFNNSEFMGTVREFLGMDYINNDLSITGSGVRVGILDTGIYHNHPRFERFLDETGRIPGWHHFDNSPGSDSSHGTQVSGIAIGIAPDIEMWHYRVEMRTGIEGNVLVPGLSSIAAIERAHADGMDIINMSFGTGQNYPFTPNTRVINRAVLDGMIVVTSAGNSGSRGWYTVSNPASLPLVITVGNGTGGGFQTGSGNNLNRGTSLGGGSSLGPVGQTHHIKPDIIAPGTQLVTTSLGHINGGYEWPTGTSMSAPVIAGVAALLRQVHCREEVTAQEIKAMIMNTARSFDSNRPFEVGAGFVDPLAALRSREIVTVDHYIPFGGTANAPWEMHTMASLSFGHVEELISDHLNEHGITATITNNREETRTYEISYYFTYFPGITKMARLSFDMQSITIEPGQSGAFTTTMSMRAGDIRAGFYEGYIYVRSGDDVVARLPFGLVTSNTTFEPYGVIFDLNGGHLDGSTSNIRLAVNRGNTIGLANVPIIQHENRNVFVGWQDGDGSILTPQEIGALTISESRRFVAVWELREAGICPTVANGQFANQMEADGVTGAAWRICEDGTLEIDEGFINWTSDLGPWNAYHDEITHVLITGPITAGTSLRSLFRNFSQVTEIEGFTYFNTTNTTNMNGIFTDTVSLRVLTLGEDFAFIGNADLPNISQTNFFTGMWQNVGNGTVRNPRGELIFTSAQLMAQYYGPEMADTFVWQPVICPVIVEGQFANQTGVNGIVGSPWRICEDGTLEIDEGFINWTAALGPWDSYHNQITRVVITGSITTGTSLRSLFRDFSQVIEIEGLTYFNTTNTTNMEDMFRASNELIRLDLSSFNTSNVTNMNGMFTDTISLRELTLGDDFTFIGGAGLPNILSTVAYTGSWQNIGNGIRNTPGEFVFTSAELMEQFDGRVMADTFVWQQQRACQVIANGQFEDQVGVNGIAGASWQLCDDGLLEVGEGFINWTTFSSPWDVYHDQIIEINFTGDITVGESLTGLFRNLSSVIAIEGLDYFDTSNVTNMALMFNNVSRLTSLDLSNWNTSNVITMANMFSGMIRLTNLDVSGYFDTSSVTNMSGMFSGAESLVNLDLSEWDTSNVTTMFNMFMRATYLTSLDLSNWDTGSVTDMRQMFMHASSLTSLNLSEWDTSNVTNMSHMFEGASSLISLDIRNWDTSRVTNMGSMFIRASSLTSLDLSNWDTSSVTDMRQMFLHANNLRSLNLRNWNTERVIIMINMFYGATSLRELVLSEYFEFGGHVGLPGVRPTSEFTGMWRNVGAGTVGNPQGRFIFTSAQLMAQYYGPEMADTFVWEPVPRPVCPTITAEGRFVNQAANAGGLAGAPWFLCDDGALKIGEGFIHYSHTTSSPWHAHRGEINRIVFTGDITAGTSLAGLFISLPNVTTIEGLSYIDTSDVRNMSRMFSGASSLESVDLSNFDTRNVDNMIQMFNGASSLTSLDLSNFNTSQVTSMSSMFNGASSLTSLDLSNFNTSQVTSMSSMFSGASSLTSLDLSNFDTSRVTSMSSMFSGASSLTSLNLSGWNTSNVTSMSWMFGRTSSLESVDLSYFDTSRVTNMSTMFYSASSLVELNLSNFDTSRVTTMRDMFRNTGQLAILDISNFNTNLVTDMLFMFTGANSLSVLSLGEYFEFRGSVNLPAVRQTDYFTGRWQNVGNGTVRNPRGEFVFTSAQLMTQYYGPEMADTWVWQPVNRQCPAIAEGRFANQAANQGGLSGAQWRLCDDGILEVGEGFIDRPRPPISHLDAIASPWDAHRNQITRIIFTGQITGGSSLNSLFRNLTSLTTIEGLENFNTGNVTSMNHMFSGASSLTSLDLSTWDTSRVTIMNSMFRGARSLTSLDLSNFDTSQLTNISHMFNGASGLISLDISSFDTRHLPITGAGSAASTGSMFTGTNALRILTLGENFLFRQNPDVPAIRVTNEFSGIWQSVGNGTVDNPTGEFNFTSAQLMSQFDGSTMADTFVWQRWEATCEFVAQGRFSPQAGENGLIGAPWVLCDDGRLEVGEGFINWTGSSSPWNANRARIDHIEFTGPITAGPSLARLFDNLHNARTIEGLEYLNTSNVTNMNQMFIFSGVTNLDLSTWDTSNVTSMSSMFSRANRLVSVDMSTWDTSNVTSMSYMFFGAYSVASLDFSSFDTSRVTNMDNMLWTSSWGPTSLRELTLGEDFVFIGSPHLSEVLLFSDTYTGRWQNIGSGTLEDPQGEFMFASPHLTSRFDGRVMADTFVWQPRNRPTDRCQVVTQGRFSSEFDGRPFNQRGLAGAQWRVCEDGRLEVDEGFIRWTGSTTGTTSPWQSNRSRINHIEFTGPVTAGTSLVGLFGSLDNVTTIDGLENIDTSRVTNMSNMFWGVTRLASLDLSTWDTSRVTNMSNMFRGTSRLASLDLTNFDTSQVRDMSNMFTNTHALRELTLGNQFSFMANAGVPTLRSTETYTGMWQNVGSGTVENPQGEFVFTSAQLMAQYYGSEMADTFVWHPFHNEGCPAVVEGQFANQPAAQGGTAGAVWRICEDKTLEIDSGFINWIQYNGPWYDHRDEITSVMIRGSITAGTSLRSLFREFQVTEIEGLTYFNTSHTTSMENMFRSTSEIVRLDLSSFDLRNVTNMQRMFTNTHALRELTLGNQFSFMANAGVPTLRSTETYTGMWQNVGNGTVDNPQGEFVFTSAQLVSQFNGATMADTWVWQPVR